MSRKAAIFAVYFVLLMTCSAGVLAANMTVAELVESYNYNFTDSTINLTAFDDYMSDDDSDGVNDTLTINVTTNASASATYLFIVSLDEEAGTIKNFSNKTVSSSDRSAQVKFDTGLLTKKRFNYSVEVRRQDFSLVYIADKMQTDHYSSYEGGVAITSVTDQSQNNNFLIVSVGLNVTKNETVNITAYLGYNNRSISATAEVSLVTPNQTVNISFDNETIKGTHYNGSFSLESVKVGSKTIAAAYNTSAYNYFDFAKTSYIRNITSRAFDNTSNNLFDALQFNLTLNITSAATYTIEAPVYDSSGNFVKTLSKNETLGVGISYVTLELSGKDVYSTYYNGKLQLSIVKLSIGNQTKDIVYDAHTTDTLFYSDFERPELPDLTLIMSLVFIATNTTNVTVNVTNSGEASAFNIVLDVFDNNTFQNQSSVDYLTANESQIFTFVAPNTTNSSVFVSVVDFDNLVDESNESNNIVDNQKVIVSLKISNLTAIYSNSTYNIFEFSINNNGSLAINNVTWTFNFGDGIILNSTINSSLAVGGAMFVYLEHNYSAEGEHTVTAQASAVTEGVSAVGTLSVGASDLALNNLSVMFSNGTERIIEFSVANNAESNLSVNWSIDFGDGTVLSSIGNANLSNNSWLFVYAHHNYASYGDYTITATAQAGSTLDSAGISIEVTDIDVGNLSVINVSGTKRMFEFSATNLIDSVLSNMSWSFDTGNAFKINSSVNSTLASDGSFFVFIDYDYGSTGTFTVNASARNGSIADYEVLNVTIT